MSAANRFVTPPPRANARQMAPPPNSREVKNHFKEVVGEDCEPPCMQPRPRPEIEDFGALRQMHTTSWQIPPCGHASLVAHMEKLASSASDDPCATNPYSDIVYLAAAVVRRYQWQRPDEITTDVFPIVVGATVGDAESLSALVKVLRDVDGTPPVSTYKVSNALTGQTIQIELPQGASGSFLREAITQQLMPQGRAKDVDTAQIQCHEVRLFAGHDELDYTRPAPSDVNMVQVQAMSRDYRFDKFIQELLLQLA